MRPQDHFVSSALAPSKTQTSSLPIQDNVLQRSSLLTAFPSGQHGMGIQADDSKDHKKEQSLVGSVGGQVMLDFSIRFEDLTFGDLLGQGGYGKVYVGKWKFNQVAIKQYTAQDFSDQTKQEIRKEGMIMATVSTQSDYLVRLKGMILERPHYSLVMEYLPGGDLFHLLKSSQEMTWPMRYQIGLDITIGLHHLHEHDVLHRDLKSLNVLLDMNFRAKLADFGLSTLKTSSASTTAGEFKGTVLWSAPELFKRGAKASAAADIYSLGMVLWELVSCRIPFADAATAAIAAMWVAQGEQETVPEGTPEEFKGLILDCWDKDPLRRPKADVIAKRLDSLLLQEHKKIPVTTINPPTSISRNEMKLSISPAKIDEEQQNALILSCERGDLKAVQEAVRGGADPSVPNTAGKHPLGSAIWGMNPQVVDYILSLSGKSAPMNWQECEQHNKRWYQQTFLIEAFSPISLNDWYELLKKIEPSPFMSALHLSAANPSWPDENSALSSLAALMHYVKSLIDLGPGYKGAGFLAILSWEARKVTMSEKTATQLNTFKSKIKEAVQPSVSLSVAPKPLQQSESKEAKKLSPKEAVILACKFGDLELVKIGIQRTGYLVAASDEEEQPLAAAVYGMNPEVVNYLLSLMGGFTALTWEDCEKHNKKWYQSTFLIPSFNPQTYGQWNELFKKIDNSDFVQKYHFSQANSLASEKYESYEFFKSSIIVLSALMTDAPISDKTDDFFLKLRKATEMGLAGFRGQISQKLIATPKLRSIPAVWQQVTEQPAILAEKMDSKVSSSLSNQDTLILACESGDIALAKLAISQGARVQAITLEQKQPLASAIWGMNPEVVEYLISVNSGTTLMTWMECKAHNQKHYGTTFRVERFNPVNFKQWYVLLKKIEPSPFLSAHYLKLFNEGGQHASKSSLAPLIKEIKSTYEEYDEETFNYASFAEKEKTEFLFVGFKTRIKQAISVAESKRAQADLKGQPSPVQAPKSTPPLPSISQAISQTILPPPKPKATPEQLTLQDQLIAACKQGDEKAVTALLKRGAKPDIPNEKGEQPLGAAVWGMCPGVVNALLKQARGVAPMTWEECKKHNYERYREVFIVEKFEVSTSMRMEAWSVLLKKIQSNPFIRNYHLQQADKQWHWLKTWNWETMFSYVEQRKNRQYVGWTKDKENLEKAARLTEAEYVHYRTQIQQAIEFSIQPTVVNTF